MRSTHLVILLAAIAIVGAGCGKKTTETNTNTTTNTSTVTNTSTNTGTTTGTFETNTNAANTNDTPATNSNPSQTTTLTITSSGISPKTLTVAAGTTVTIVNNDSRGHEIASNPHPSHDNLPGFDEAISAGSSGSFTFTQTGSWGYHDHDDPFDSRWQGTVIVQ